MIIWITGKAGAGKTTYAKNVMKSCWFKLFHKCILLDGDDVRKYFPTGFSDKEREEHIMKIARFAALLESQGFTIFVALVSPKKKWRQEARKLFKKSELVYLKGGMLWEGTTYEIPDEEELQPVYR